MIKERNGEGGRRRGEVQIKLSFWLKERKMETSRANYVRGEIVSHDVCHFHPPISVPSQFSGSREPGEYYHPCM